MDFFQIFPGLGIGRVLKQNIITFLNLWDIFVNLQFSHKVEACTFWRKNVLNVYYQQLYDCLVYVALYNKSSPLISSIFFNVLVPKKPNNLVKTSKVVDLFCYIWYYVTFWYYIYDIMLHFDIIFLLHLILWYIYILYYVILLHLILCRHIYNRLQSMGTFWKNI